MKKVGEMKFPTGETKNRRRF